MQREGFYFFQPNNQRRTLRMVNASLVNEWPTADVGLSLRHALESVDLIRIIDYLYHNCRIVSAHGPYRVGCLARSVSILSLQSIPKGRPLVYQITVRRCRRSFRPTQVSVLRDIRSVLLANHAYRGLFLPVMILTLPLPSHIVQLWPANLVIVLQWIAFGSFAVALSIPWLFCIYQLATTQISPRKRFGELFNDAAVPRVVVVMPCYKEEKDVLIQAVDSVTDCDYPPACLHLFLSFDGDQQDELYMNTISHMGVPLDKESYPTNIDITYKSVRVTVSRFSHGGKRHCQKETFQVVDQVYRSYIPSRDNIFILFIDSDCVLDAICIQNFIYGMELSPGNNRDILAMTGVITATTKKHSLITLLQDMEYIHGQLFERTVESGCGAVTCLPGALTMLRYSTFRKMAKYYFTDNTEKCEDLFDFAKCHMGEDRWLTHLFMIGAKKRYQIQICTSAFCKTEAVQTYTSLVKQRRRWFMGFITNEVCMLTDWRLWNRYPILILIRFIHNTVKTTSLVFFVLVFAFATTMVSAGSIPIGIVGVSLGMNWLLMFYFGAKLRRFKIWLYPIMFILNPIFNWYYMVYGVLTAGQRTWGGPRTDAAAKDANIPIDQGAEYVEKQDGHRNATLESFLPVQERQREYAKSDCTHGSNLDRSYSLLQPPDTINGILTERSRSTSSIELDRDGWNKAEEGVPTCSDSIAEDEIICTMSLEQMEECMGDEDRLKYHAALQMGP